MQKGKKTLNTHKCPVEHSTKSNCNVTTDSKNLVTKTIQSNEVQKETIAKDSPKENMGVTGLVAIMEPNHDSKTVWSKDSIQSRPSNKITVLLNTGSNRDLFFHEKGKPKYFP